MSLATAGLAIVAPSPARAQTLLSDDNAGQDDADGTDDEEDDEEDARQRDAGRDGGTSAPRQDQDQAGDQDALRELTQDQDLQSDVLPEELEEEMLAAQRLRRDEAEPGPYDPLGIRLGSFLLFPEFEVDRGYTDNVFTSSTVKRSDWSTDLTPSFELRSDWSRNALVGTFGYEKVLQDEFTSEDQENIDAGLRGRLDIGRRITLGGETSYVTDTESRGDVNVPNNVAQRPTETTKSGGVQIDHSFNRLTARLRGELTQEEFEDVSLVGGGTFNNAARDNTEREMIGRLSYELKPGVAIYTEGRGNEIEMARPNAAGLLLDSNGWAALGGLSLDIGGTITGEIGAGFAQQLPDNGTLQGIEGAILAANVVWAISPLTSVRFDAGFDVETTILDDSIGSLVRTVGLEVEHAFRRNLILTAGVTYELEDYASADQEDETLEVVVEGEYLLNRSVGLVAGYEFTDYSSNNPGSGYSENEFRLGLRLRR